MDLVLVMKERFKAQSQEVKEWYRKSAALCIVALLCCWFATFHCLVTTSSYQASITGDGAGTGATKSAGGTTPPCMTKTFVVSWLASQVLMWITLYGFRTLRTVSLTALPPSAGYLISLYGAGLAELLAALSGKSGILLIGVSLLQSGLFLQRLYRTSEKVAGRVVTA